MFKIITVAYKHPERKPVITNVQEFESVQSVSKKDGLKLNFKYKPKYVALKNINTYDIIEIGKYAIMVFSDTFTINEDHALRMYAMRFLVNIETRIQSLNDTADIWNNTLNELNQNKAIN